MRVRLKTSQDRLLQRMDLAKQEILTLKGDRGEESQSLTMAGHRDEELESHSRAPRIS